MMDTRHPPSRLAQRAWVAALTLGLTLPAATPLALAQDMPVPAHGKRAPVTLNFVNAPIPLVTQAMAKALGREILVDAKVTAPISITMEKALPVAEAWRYYLAALRSAGATVVENGGLLKVVIEADGKIQSGTVLVEKSPVRGDMVITQIFKLNHENPNNLMPLLRPLLSPNMVLNANAASGTLIVTDYADNIQRIGKIIAALDEPAASETEIITLKHALAADIAPLVQKLSESSGAIAVPGAAPGKATDVSVMVEPRSNSLIVRAPNAARMLAAKQMIEKLDRPTQGGGPAGSIWVVYLKNADAVKLAEVLRATMAAGMANNAAGSTSGVGGGAPSAPGGPRLMTPSQMGGIGQAPNTSGAAAGGSGGLATTPVSQSAGPTTGGQITADPSSNSLIIAAPEPVYRQLRQVIDQLDTRRAQIYVESMIVKVDADKSAEFGIQWQGLLANSNNTQGIVAGTNYAGAGNILNLSLLGASGTAPTTVPLGAGLNIGLINMIQGVYTLGALARFFESTNAANILSTPNLVALDNEEAKIVIGQNVPFVTGSFTNTGASSGSVNPFQTIERKDVGLTLKVKSQVGEGGTVRMTIQQENSSVTGNAPGNAGLITDKSSIETTVIVNDGQMIVLGGLMKDEFTDTEGRIPGLANIPLVGNLFKNDARKRVKSNLMVFLRPVVMRDQTTSDRIAMDRYDSIRAVQQTQQPDPNALNSITDAPVLPPNPMRNLPPAAASQPPLNLPPPASMPTPQWPATSGQVDPTAPPK